MKNDSQTKSGGDKKKKKLKPPQVKREISPNKFKDCLGFCLPREGQAS